MRNPLQTTILAALSVFLFYVPVATAQVSSTHTVTIIVPRYTTHADSTQTTNAGQVYREVLSNVAPGKIITSRVPASRMSPPTVSSPVVGKETIFQSRGVAHQFVLPQQMDIENYPISGLGAGVREYRSDHYIVTITD